MNKGKGISCHIILTWTALMLRIDLSIYVKFLSSLSVSGPIPTFQTCLQTTVSRHKLGT